MKEFIIAMAVVFTILFSIVGVFIYAGTVGEQQYIANQNLINTQSQNYISSIESKGYTVNHAHFDSPAITVTVNSFQELFQKAIGLNTTDVYAVTNLKDVNGSTHNITSFYVIDSIAAYAYEFTPNYGA